MTPYATTVSILSDANCYPPPPSTLYRRNTPDSGDDGNRAHGGTCVDKPWRTESASWQLNVKAQQWRRSHRCAATTGRMAAKEIGHTFVTAVDLNMVSAKQASTRPLRRKRCARARTTAKVCTKGVQWHGKERGRGDVVAYIGCGKGARCLSTTVSRTSTFQTAG